MSRSRPSIPKPDANTLNISTSAEYPRPPSGSFVAKFLRHMTVICTMAKDKAIRFDGWPVSASVVKLAEVFEPEEILEAVGDRTTGTGAHLLTQLDESRSTSSDGSLHLELPPDLPKPDLFDNTPGVYGAGYVDKNGKWYAYAGKSKAKPNSCKIAGIWKGGKELLKKSLQKFGYGLVTIAKYINQRGAGGANGRLFRHHCHTAYRAANSTFRQYRVMGAERTPDAVWNLYASGITQVGEKGEYDEMESALQFFGENFWITQFSSYDNFYYRLAFEATARRLYEDDPPQLPPLVPGPKVQKQIGLESGGGRTADNWNDLLKTGVSVSPSLSFLFLSACVELTTIQLQYILQPHNGRSCHSVIFDTTSALFDRPLVMPYTVQPHSRNLYVRTSLSRICDALASSQLALSVELTLARLHNSRSISRSASTPPILSRCIPKRFLSLIKNPLSSFCWVGSLKMKLRSLPSSPNLPMITPTPRRTSRISTTGSVTTSLPG